MFDLVSREQTVKKTHSGAGRWRTGPLGGVNSTSSPTSKGLLDRMMSPVNRFSRISRPARPTARPPTPPIASTELTARARGPQKRLIADKKPYTLDVSSEPALLHGLSHPPEATFMPWHWCCYAAEAFVPLHAADSMQLSAQRLAGKPSAEQKRPKQPSACPLGVLINPWALSY